jgi:hypothetical protein
MGEAPRVVGSGGARSDGRIRAGGGEPLILVGLSGALRGDVRAAGGWPPSLVVSS